MQNGQSNRSMKSTSLMLLASTCMYVADTLSRAFLDEQHTDTDLNDDMEVMVLSLITNLPMTQEKLAQMKSANVK